MHNELATHIAETLQEAEPEAVATIARVVKILGPDRIQAVFQETLQVERNGGMTIEDGTRRRSAGGVFFKLLKNHTSTKERWSIFGPSWKNTNLKPAAVPLTPEQIEQLITSALQQKGTIKTAKITVIGRPGRVIEKGELIMTTCQGAGLPSLPKGLPSPPPNPPLTCLLFISRKQWQKVREVLNADKNDKLIVESYPVLDGRIGSGTVVVYVQNCTTQILQRQQRQNDIAQKDRA